MTFKTSKIILTGMLAMIAYTLYVSASDAAPPTLVIDRQVSGKVVLAVKGTRAYAREPGATTDLYISDDKGATWSLRYHWPNGRLWYLNVLPSGTLIAHVSYGTTNLWRSTNDGASWTQVLALPNNSEAYYTTLDATNIASDGSCSYLATYNTAAGSPHTNYVYRSCDDGGTWQLVATRKTERHYHGLYAASDGLYLLAGDTTGQGGIFKSTDRGVTWKPVCTDYTCVAIDAMEYGDSLVYGADNLGGAAIWRIRRSDGVKTKLADIPLPSYSAHKLASGWGLVGTTREAGSTYGALPLYAVSPDGLSAAEIWRWPLGYGNTSADKMIVSGSYPDGSFPISLSRYGTVFAHLTGGSVTPPPAPRVLTDSEKLAVAEQVIASNGLSGVYQTALATAVGGSGS